MARTIWTIGHSTHPLEVFLDLLGEHGITMLLDVRRFAGSRRLPWFASAPLAEALAGRGIGYLHMPALGGRRAPVANSPHTTWQNSSFRGYADHMDTAAFHVAFEKLKEVAEAHPTCFMCAELLWWSCHRSLIADRLKAEGWTVLHITPKGAQEHPYTSAARIVDGRLTYADPSLL